jgi:hypothetical protein
MDGVIQVVLGLHRVAMYVERSPLSKINAASKYRGIFKPVSFGDITIVAALLTMPRAEVETNLCPITAPGSRFTPVYLKRIISVLK